MTRLRKALAVLLCACIVASVFSALGLCSAFAAALKVSSVEMFGGQTKSVYQFTEGFWQTDENNQRYFEYYIPVEEDDSLAVTYEDGSVVSYKFKWGNGAENFFVSDDGKKLVESKNFNYGDEQDTKHWSVGENKFFIYFGEQKFEIPVKILPNPVKKFKFTTDREPVLYYNFSGRTEKDSKGQDYFLYNTGWFEEGDKITVTYDDECGDYSVDYYFSRDGEAGFFDGNGGSLDMNKLSFDDGQYFKHWTSTGTYPITISYFGLSDTFNVKVVESPIESIEYKSASPAEFAEGKNGTVKKDENGVEYFEYWVPVFDKDVLTIHYKGDKGAVDYVCAWDDSRSRFAYTSKDGEKLYEKEDVFFESNQYLEHWGLGEHEFRVICSGASAVIKLNVVKETEPASVSQDMSGSTGGCEWKYDTANKALTISGNGETAHYAEDGAPWKDFDIKTLIVEDGVTALRSGGMRDTNVETAKIAGSVKTIGMIFFSQCKNLKTVELSEGLEEINGGAFEGCENLESVNLPETLLRLGPFAFAECGKLELSKIPNSISEMGFNALYDTAWFKNQPDGEVYAGSVLIGYKGEMPENYVLKIKDGVKAVAAGAFAGAQNLAGVEIPASVERIGENAFYACPSLTEVNIPATLKIIEPKAFGCFYDEETKQESYYKDFKLTGENISLIEKYEKENGFIAEPTVEPTEPTSQPTTEPTQPVTQEPTEPATVTEPVSTEPQTTEPATQTPTVTKSEKKANPIKVTVKKKAIKANKLKAKKQTLKAITVKNAKGKICFKIKSAKKSIKKLLKINSKGVITVKRWKKPKKGTYKIKVSITAKGNEGYLPKTITKTIKLKIK